MLINTEKCVKKVLQNILLNLFFKFVTNNADPCRHVVFQVSFLEKQLI